MAKRKKSHVSEESKLKYNIELTGLLLVLIAILGITSSGPIGGLIKNFEIFLMGNMYIGVFLILMILGLYMMFKRKLPKFFSQKMIGFYLILIAVLTLSHSCFISDSGVSIQNVIGDTIDKFMESASATFSSQTSNNIAVGGGIIGALFSVIFIKLFDRVGTYVVLAIFGLFGIALFFDFSFADIFTNFSEWLKNRQQSKKEEKVIINSTNSQHDDDDKVVISSVQELYDKKNEQKSPQHEEQMSFEQPKKEVNYGDYVIPSIEILDKPKNNRNSSDVEILKNNKSIIERVLNDFQIFGRVVNIHEGPAVTQYEVDIKAGTKLSRVTSINKEIALALAAKDVRIMAPIPGKSTVGIEIPNRVISSVSVREVLENVPKSMEKSNILVALGKDIMGNIMTADLSKMPHLLVAGTTGSGKSVCINSFIASIILRYSPDEVKLVLVDPKKVELSNYRNIPHMYLPVVTDPKVANIMLKKIVKEMERRYEIFSEKECKNIATYNQYLESEQRKHPDLNIKKLPYIVVIIDELADLMLVAAKEVEDSIMRITQMARAAGIHLIVATQRPSTDVITGIVKANIPSRIAFAVSNGIDSRTILDQTGAEKLLGKGDMLYLPMGENAPIRIQGTYISDEEIKRVIDAATKTRQAVFEETLDDPEDDKNVPGNSSNDDYDDPIYNEVVDFAVRTGKVSASLLQRKFRLGFNRAARMVDLLEERGIVGPQNGSKPREVLVKLENNNQTEDVEEE